MFANRYTAYIDACSLAGALKRNLLLTLAEAEFFRLRWSQQVLDETQKAIREILLAKDAPDADERSKRAVTAITEAFKDAMVADYDDFLSVADALPDKDDAHVLAAALKTRARSTDEFLANTITLDPGKAVWAIRKLRVRLK